MKQTMSCCCLRLGLSSRCCSDTNTKNTLATYCKMARLAFPASDLPPVAGSDTDQRGKILLRNPDGPCRSLGNTPARDSYVLHMPNYVGPMAAILRLFPPPRSDSHHNMTFHSCIEHALPTILLPSSLRQWTILMSPSPASPERLAPSYPSLCLPRGWQLRPWSQAGPAPSS